MLRWLWLSLVVLILDQITKAVARATLAMHEPWAVLPMLNFTLLHNTGAAFSFLADAGGWQRIFFTVLAVIASVILVVWLKRLSSSERNTAVALALILGGAVGNLIDRLWLGYVVDFIQVHYQNAWHFPAFNIADSAICIGAALLLVITFRGRETAHNEDKEP